MSRNNVCKRKLQGGHKLFTTFQTYINHKVLDIRKWIELFKKLPKNFRVN
jgi:hypothetical protein